MVRTRVGEEKQQSVSVEEEGLVMARRVVRWGVEATERGC